MAQPHFLLVTFPAQGHINPGLQLAKRLISIGVRVTFATSDYAIRRIEKNSTTHAQGLSFAAFSDGYENGYNSSVDVNHYMGELERLGSLTLSDFIASSTKQGNGFTCIVYSILIPWVAKVGKAHNVPTTLFWNQTAIMFGIYYYYFKGYGDVIRNNIEDPSFSVSLPGLPELRSRDLPSFFIPSDPYSLALPAFKEHLDILDEETNPKILVNTYDTLESEALKAIHQYNMVGIGPLIPSAFLDGKDPSDTSFGGDLFMGYHNEYVEWLNAKPKSSVIYVSFGSLSVLSKPQMEELARGLIDTGRPFLWVIRSKEGGEEDKEEDNLSCKEELEKQGKIVPWCSQVEVLSHPSVGCFVTHCGWNSTFESLCSGVPTVAFPQWTDQATNAKLLEDVWKTGVRVNVNEEGIVEGPEIKRCLEIVLGDEEKGKEMRRNAKKWKDLAREAAKEGGSSDKNLNNFVEKIAKGW
ncbi:crocetin glucosyltransferase, chloroplastic-like [Mangifera indica]|uniref:crocetin glucosyltransferase, chloroplastic-like n=1 Tax=Mangifera indica TaxID=29780 RepID=UPI001CFB99B1|nr:crocetin glucosyltransferase, chloroplastic-like [Mangifera indica]